MTSIILIIIGVVLASVSASLIFIQKIKLDKGLIVIEEGFDGHKQVSDMLNTVIRVYLKRSIQIRKLLSQYFLHAFVRILKYVDTFSSYLYAKSRNMFVENAVKNRGTVPHFWQHLKVYKQEMDKEKEE